MTNSELQHIGELSLESFQLRRRVHELEGANAELDRELRGALRECDRYRSLRDGLVAIANQQIASLERTCDFGNERWFANRIDALRETLKTIFDLEIKVGLRDRKATEPEELP